MIYQSFAHLFKLFFEPFQAAVIPNLMRFFQLHYFIFQIQIKACSFLFSVPLKGDFSNGNSKYIFFQLFKNISPTLQTTLHGAFCQLIGQIQFQRALNLKLFFQIPLILDYVLFFLSNIYSFKMLPKLQKSSLVQSVRKDNQASLIQCEDQLKSIINRLSNQPTKPWNNKYTPKSPESPFGDFPKDYLPKKKVMTEKHEPNYENSISGHFIQKENKKKKAGKRFSTLQQGKSAAQILPKCGAFEKRQIPSTDFRRYYERGDLPIKINYSSSAPKLTWRVQAETLDYHHYLPLFVEGCRQKIDPFRFFAIMGTYDMLEKSPKKTLEALPQLIIPMKVALNTRDPEIIAVMLKIIQRLVLSGEMIGEALVPYYRQLLPIFNLFKNSNKNLGDKMEYSQRKRLNLGDLIAQTLQLLEQTGGEDAFINIKYMIPTYESCILN